MSTYIKERCQVSRTVIVGLNIFWLIAASIQAETATNSDIGQRFQFKFELNQPLVYAIEVKAETVTHSSTGDRSWIDRNSENSRYKVRLTAIKANQDGTTTVHFEPFDYQYDAESTGPSGQSVSLFRGLDIIRKQNGVVTIDTAKDIGVPKAYFIKLTLYPMLLSGYMGFNAAGKVKRIDGDLPFIDYWTRTLKSLVDYFHIDFPSQPITTDGTNSGWSVRYLSESVGDTSFFGPSAYTNTFSRKPDIIIDGTPVATISMTGARQEKHCGAFTEEVAGQKTSISLSQCDFTNSGMFHFDLARGSLVDETIGSTCTVLQTVSPQNDVTVTNHLDMRMDVRMTLISGSQQVGR
jgi:hypothetical protein